jgi:hypothetical protein
MASDKDHLYQASTVGAVRQCEILSEVKQLNPIVSFDQSGKEIVSVEQITHPFCIVVSQDCDLDWDYWERQKTSKEQKPGKLLNSVLFCEIEPADKVRYDTDRVQNRKAWDKIPKNDTEKRFHFLDRVPPALDGIQQGLPELTADFKRVFSIDAAYLYQQIAAGSVTKRTCLVSPYLEDFSTRFRNYHGRIALPSAYESEKP